MSNKETDGTGSVLDQAEKTCFVIAPIGAEGSEVRVRSDLVLKYIIRPATEQCGYDPDKNVIRADQFAKPGMITNEIVKQLFKATVAVADLTDKNANVFYELAIRHAFKKPVALLFSSADEQPPFDVLGLNYIRYDITNWDSPGKCIAQLVEQIRHMEKEHENSDNPVTRGLQVAAIEKAPQPHDFELQILKHLEILGQRMQDVENGMRRQNTITLNPITPVSGFFSPMEDVLAPLGGPVAGRLGVLTTSSLSEAPPPYPKKK